MIRCAGKGWHRVLRDLFKSADQDVLICSPFVGHRGTAFVCENLPSGFSGNGRLLFLTNLSVVNVCQLVTDPRALKMLTGSIPQSTIHHVPGLHAKAYIVDDKQVIVTSGNLTSGGLYRNLEYGVVVSDHALVRSIRSDLEEFAKFGAVVPP